MQIERGGYSKALQPTAWCIRLNTNILQGSPANNVGIEPIFVSNVELYRFKHLIISTLHPIQLVLGRLGLWVRAPSGSLRKSKTMKTADNQSLSAVFLFIHTANWSRIPHLTWGEIGGLNFHIKTSPPNWIIFHWFSAFCIKRTLFKTCIFTPSKKEEYGNAKKLFYGIVFPEEIKAA